jgi:hypothetical protein
MIDLSQYTLGETDEIFSIDNYAGFYQTLLIMSQQSRRNILVFSHDLDHRIYDTEAMYAAFKVLAIASRQSYIQFLLQESKPVTSKGHRLLELSRHLSSHVSIRITAKEHRNLLQTFVIVDERGFMIQENPSRYDAKCNFYAPLHARDLKEKFVNMWEHGEEDSSLRRLGL